MPEPEKIEYEGELSDWLAIEFGTTSLTEFFRDRLYIDGQKISFDGSFVIPEGTTRIGNYAFYGCDEMTELTIPASMQDKGQLHGH